MAATIVHIIPNLDRGGAELLLLHICREIPKHNPSIHFAIITLLKPGHLSSDFESLGITVHSFKMAKHSALLNLIGLARLIRSIKPDAIHTHLLPADRFGLLAGLLAGVKYRFSTIHNMEPTLDRKSRVAVYLAKWLSTGLVAVSQAVKDHYCSRYGFRPDTIRVIHNAPGFLSPPASKVREFRNIKRIVNVGNFKEEKGQLFLVRAMKYIDTQCSLDMYGNYGGDYGDYYKIVQNEIENLNLSARITLKGFVSDITAVLASYDLMVTPSTFEGFGMVNVEAMAVGLPVVASDIPPHREIFKGMPEWLLFQPGNPEAIAQAINKIGSDKIIYEQICRQMLSQSKQFSVEAMAENYLSFYCDRLKIAHKE